MEKVKVNKEELLRKLTENFEKWKKVHEKAMEAYWKAVGLALRRARRKVGRKDDTWTNGLILTRPENHSADFETAIRMITMSCEETVEIGEEDFNAYVLNRWHWREGYIARASVYLGCKGATGPTGPTGDEGAQGTTGVDF